MWFELGKIVLVLFLGIFLGTNLGQPLWATKISYKTARKITDTKPKEKLFLTSNKATFLTLMVGVAALLFGYWQWIFLPVGQLIGVWLFNKYLNSDWEL